MIEQKTCGRCGSAVDHQLGRDEYRCMACRTWESAMRGRTPRVPNAIREGLTLLRPDTMSADLWYPRAEGEPTYLQLGLYDVRAADDLRISYDFDRNGWVVEQCWTEEVPRAPDPGGTYGYTDSVEHWQEVGFFQAWALEREKGIMQHEEDDD